MTHWVQAHLGLIYQIQAAAFIVLAVVACLLPRRGGALRLAPHIWLLGLFALLHALTIFLAWELQRQPATWLLVVGGILLPLSYLPLMEFGRRSLATLFERPPRWIWWLYPVVGAAILLCVVMADDPARGLNAGSRLFLGLPGALLAAGALFVASFCPAERHSIRPFAPWLWLAAACMAGYGLLIPIIGTQAIGLLGWLPTEAWFQETVGVPVRLLRGGFTVTVALALMAVVRQSSLINNDDLDRVMGTLSGFLYRCRNDEDWTPLYMVGDIEGMTGYSVDAFLSTREATLQDIVHPDDRDRVWDEIQSSLEDRGAFEVTFRVIRADGQTGWFYDHGRGIYDDAGKLLFLEGHVVDATALEQARADLHQFQTTLDRTLDAVFIFDAETLRFTYVNQGAARQVGWSREALLTMHPYDIKPEFPEPQFREMIAPLIHGDMDLRRFETVHLTRHGQRVPVEIFLQYIAPPGERPRFVAIVHDIAERLRAERALRDTNDRLEQAERHAALGHWELAMDDDDQAYWSSQLYRLLATDPSETTPSLATFLERLHPDDRTAVSDALEALEADREPTAQVVRSNPAFGPQRHLAPTYRCIRDQGGGRRFLGTLQDVTEREEATARLRQSEQQQRDLRDVAQREQSRMAALLSGMNIGILFEDRKGNVEYVNPAFRRMWAISDELELVGEATRSVLEHSTHQFARPDHASKHVLQVLDTQEISERFEVDLYDGRVLTQLSYPVNDTEGRLIGRLWIYEDVTHERQTAQQLVYLAEHDPLTGLYNRHRFQEHLERTIKASQRMHARFALMYFDLDDFKHINDNFGHRAGDTVLVRTAGEVASLVRGGDLFARLGGDEFAILTELTDSDDPARLAERVVHAVSAIPLRFRGSNFRLTVSVGIAIFPDHGSDAESLVAHADTAMYQAKQHGKNTWALYDASADRAEANLERLSWTTRIAAALDEDLFELHFQGIYRTADGGLSHLEALVRMRDPADNSRILMPGQFIPIAEKSGQILDIDRWVLRQSVETLADHQRLSGLAVNLSGRSFDDPGMARYIERLLAEHGVDPGRLIIELTETAAVSEMQDAQRFIEQLQQAGCTVCLDDFGSGFSTFAYLKYLAVQILKIDGMFIRDLPNNRDNQAFVKAMIDVAAGLRKRTIAEFVEDGATLALLREMGVDLAQGYHLDRPRPDHPGLNGEAAYKPRPATLSEDD